MSKTQPLSRALTMKMEESFPASLLMVAGLLRLAGASSSEPWTRHSTDQSLLEETMMTAESHSVSISEGYRDEVTLPFDSVTSEPSSEGISLLRKVSRTEPEGISKHDGQLLNAVARQPDSSEQPFSDGAILSHQNDAVTTCQPPVTTGVPRLNSKSFSPMSIDLATFLLKGNRRGNATDPVFRISGESPSPQPDKPEERDLFAATPFDSESLNIAGQTLELVNNPTRGVSTVRYLHEFPLRVNRTGLDRYFAATLHTTEKEGMVKYATNIPQINQTSQVTNRQTQLDITTSDVTKTLGSQTEGKSPSDKESPVPIFQQPYFGNHGAAPPATELVQCCTSSPLSPHRVIIGLDTTEISGRTEKPALLRLYQSSPYPSTFLTAPQTLPPKSAQPFPLATEISQSMPPSLPFSPQTPHPRRTDTSSGAEEPLAGSMDSVLHHQADQQMTTQVSLFTVSPMTVRKPLAVTYAQETIEEEQPNVSLPAHSDTQTPRGFSSVYGQPQVRVSSPFPDTTSSHMSSPVLSKETFAHVELSSPVTSNAARPTMQGVSEFPLPTIFSTSHKEQTSLDKFVPSYIESEPLTTSSGPVLARLQRPSIHAGPKSSRVSTPSQDASLHESQPPMVTTAVALTKVPMLGNVVAPYPERETLTVTSSAHFKPTQLSLSTLVYGEQQERALSTFVPFLVNQPKITNSVSFHTSVPSQIGVDTPAISSVSELEIPGVTFLEHTKTKLLPNIPAFFHDMTPPTPAQVYTTLQRLSTSSPTHGEQPESILDTAVPSEAESHVPDGSASFTGKSLPLVTSKPPDTKRHKTAVEGGPPAIIDAKTMRADISVSAPNKVPSQVEQQLSKVPVKLRAQTLPSNEMQIPTTFSSASIQHHSLDVVFHPHLKPSGTFSSSHTKSPSLKSSTSADAGTQTSGLVTLQPLTLRPQASDAVLVTPHTPGSEGNSPLPTRFPASQASAYRTTWQDSSTPVSSRQSPTSFTHLATPASEHNQGRVLVLNSAHVEDSPVSLRVTPALTVAAALDLVRTSEAFLQHLNRSEDLGAAALDSLEARGYLGTPLSLQYLSLLIQNAGNTVCLQHVQNATPVLDGSSSNGHGEVSAQESLAFSSVLGLPHFAASSIIQMSPSSVILVKPVFVFLPAETPRALTPLSAYTEKASGAGTSSPFTNAAALGASGGHHEQLAQTKLTLTAVQHPGHTTVFTSSGAYLTAKHVVSEPVFRAFPKFTEPTLFRSSNLTSNPSPFQVRELSIRVPSPSLQRKNHNDEFPLSTPDSPQVQENNSVSLSLGASESPPDMEADLKRTQIFQFPTGQLSIPAKATPLSPLMEPVASQLLGSFLQTPRTSTSPQLGTRLMLHTRDLSYGSMTPVPPIKKDLDESLKVSSAENMKLPLELGHLTFSRPTSYSNLSTKLFVKTLLKGQYVPMTTSNSPSLPKEFQESVSLNYSSSKSMVTFPMATEMLSYPLKNAFSKPSSLHIFSPESSMANKRLRFVPSSSILLSADAPVQTTLPRKHLDPTRHHEVPSGPPAAVHSESLSHSFLPKAAMGHNPTTRIHSGRTSLLGTGDQPVKRMDAGETNQSGFSNGTHNSVATDAFESTVPGTEIGQQLPGLVATGFQSMTTSPDSALGLVDLQNSFHITSLHAAHSVVSASALEDTSASPAGGDASVLETSHHVLNSLLQPSTEGTSKPAFSSPLVSQDQNRRVDITGTEDKFLIPSNSVPQPSSQEDNHLGISGELDDDRMLRTASVLPTSSFMFPSLLNAPPLIMAVSSSSVATHRLAGRYQNKASHLVDISKRVRSLQTQIEPTLRNLSDTSNIRTDGDFSEDTTSSTGDMNEVHLHTIGDQIAVTSNTTVSGEEGRGGEEAEDDVVADLPPWDSDWRAQHHRNMMLSDDVFLNGFAVVSDDLCSSGNYTTEMSLRPATTGHLPSSPVTFLAQIVLKDNRSHASLSIKSCCVTPSARPTKPEGASCCLFPRSLVECRSIQVHQNSKSQTANFTIQLFQMLDHSVVYLHCELGICLSQQTGCEQSCLDHKETHSGPNEGSSYETLRNIISLGPVVKPQAEFPPGPVIGSPETVLHLGLVLSSIGTLVFLAMVLVLWRHWRPQTKMATTLEGGGSETP